MLINDDSGRVLRMADRHWRGSHQESDAAFMKWKVGAFNSDFITSHQTQRCLNFEQSQSQKQNCIWVSADSAKAK